MWQAFAASTRGTSHLHTNLPCQDAHHYQLLDSLAVAAVADGLGSAAAADQGAQLVVKTIVDQLVHCLTTQPMPVGNTQWQELLTAAFKITRTQLEREATAQQRPLRDFATTLLVAVVMGDGVAVAHLGDGAIVVQWQDSENTIETLSPPQRGEYANEVVPLTAVDALTHLRCSYQPLPPRGIALLTDGLQNLALNLALESAHSGFFAPFFEALATEIDSETVSAELATFLDSERICARTDDDKTLLIVGQRPTAL